MVADALLERSNNSKPSFLGSSSVFIGLVADRPIGEVQFDEDEEEAERVWWIFLVAPSAFCQ